MATTQRQLRQLQDEIKSLRSNLEIVTKSMQELVTLVQPQPEQAAGCITTVDPRFQKVIDMVNNMSAVSVAVAECQANTALAMMPSQMANSCIQQLQPRL